MELTIDSKKKNVLQKQIAKSKKSVYVIKTISQVLLYAGLVGGILYLVVNFASPTLSMVNVNGVPKKNVSFIIITSSFIFAPCLIFSACLNVLSKNLAGGNSSYRVDETLILSDSQLKYSFRLKHQSLSSERRVITIDFSDISSLRFDEVTGMIDFTGDILSEYFDDYKNKKPVNTVKLEKFMICDYFTPSLRDTLQGNSVSRKAI